MIKKEKLVSGNGCIESTPGKGCKELVPGKRCKEFFFFFFEFETHLFKY